MRLTLVLGSLLFAAAAHAGDPSAAGTSGRHSIDTNGDGIVTRDEAKAFPRLAEDFNAVDVNKDGQLDTAEMDAHREQRHAEMRASAEARWKEADKDGNGSLSREEASAAMPRLAENFDKMDANGDGQISRDEMHGIRMKGGKELRREAVDRFKAADTNGDRALDLAEAQTSMPWLAQRFTEVDADGDGKITPRELKAATKQP